MHQVFRDDNLNDEFRRGGYLLLKGALTASEVDRLQRFRREHPFPGANPFLSTNYSDDPDYRRRIFRFTDSIITPALEPVLNDYIGASAAFFVKKAGRKSTVGMHLDWQLVDETEFIGLNVWTPLVRTHRWNGRLELVPGSAAGNPMHRGPNYRLPQMFMQHPGQLQRHTLAFSVKPGDLVIYDNRMLHYSKSNRWFFHRPALSFLMIPAKAQPVHYFFEAAKAGEPQTVRKYEVDVDFYVERCRFRQRDGVYSPSDGLPDTWEDVTAESRALLEQGVRFLDEKFT